MPAGAAPARRGRGSWPLLAIASLAFLAAFALLRWRSPFLRIERDRPAAAAVAAAHGLTLAEAMALRDLVGVDAAASTWDAAAAAFAARRTELGDALAAIAAAGRPDLATAARAGAADAEAAWTACRGDPAAVPGLRFLALRDRFAQRITARD